MVQNNYTEVWPDEDIYERLLGADPKLNAMAAAVAIMDGPSFLFSGVESP